VKELKTDIKCLYQIRRNPRLLYFPLKIYAAQIIHHPAIIKSPELKE